MRGVPRQRVAHLDQGSQPRWAPLQQFGQILSRMFGAAEVHGDFPARTERDDALVKIPVRGSAGSRANLRIRMLVSSLCITSPNTACRMNSSYAGRLRPRRVTHGYRKLTVFRFDVWLAGLILTIVALSLLSVFAFRGARWIRPVGYITRTYCRHTLGENSRFRAIRRANAWFLLVAAAFHRLGLLDDAAPASKAFVICLTIGR